MKKLNYDVSIDEAYSYLQDMMWPADERFESKFSYPDHDQMIFDEALEQQDYVDEEVVRICEEFGHDLEGADFGNSESGFMGVRCARCGWSDGQWLY